MTVGLRAALACVLPLCSGSALALDPNFGR